MNPPSRVYTLAPPPKTRVVTVRSAGSPPAQAPAYSSALPRAPSLGGNAADAANQSELPSGATILYFVAACVLGLLFAVIVAVIMVVVRTKGQLHECFFVSFAHIPDSDGSIPANQGIIDKQLAAMNCIYATNGQLQAAYEQGAQWCQAGFFDSEPPIGGLISGVGWPNQKAGAETTCGATGINYIAVPVVSPPNGGPKAADLQQFAGKVTGFIAFGLKPSSNNVYPQGSILPFAANGKWSQYD